MSTAAMSAAGKSAAGKSSKGSPARPVDMARGEYRAIRLPTLVEYCRHYAASANAHAPAFTHVTDRPGNHERLSFDELDVRARAIAAEIQRRGGTGRPVLVVQDPGVDYAASLFGCLYARAIAVPVYPPQMLRLQQTMPRLQAMIANAGAKCMLSTRAIIGDRLHPMWQMPDSNAIAVEEVRTTRADDWDSILPRENDVAVLQYTSGSTGNPRGVVLTHRVLLNNLRAVIEHYHFEGANSVQWVPPYHDMGLIGGIFVPIYRGVEAVVISPVDFVRNPLLWLQCIDHYNGTSNGSPNFGYDLCVRRIKAEDCDKVNLDLSSWKVAIAGAEPVRASTLRNFTEKFAPYGFAPETFCPAFGMAETTVVATGKRLGERHRTVVVDSAQLQSGRFVPVGRDIDRDPKCDAPHPKVAASEEVATQEMVSCGVAVEGMAFEIVDPTTRRRVPDGTVGEIWFRGNSIARGYWNDPAATTRTFGAKIQDDPVNDPFEFLRTGDLGARIQDELYVTGRLKELIIVGGRNFYPHDVEELVQSVSEAFRADTGTAFSIDTGTSEELVVVQELWRPKKFQAEHLLPVVVASIAETLQVTPHAVVLVQSGTLPKTSSGKLRRSDTKQWFLDGELSELARWQPSTNVTSSEIVLDAPRSPTEIVIAEIWSRLLNLESVGRDDDFFRLGGGSLLVAQMLTEVAERLGIDVGMTMLFRHPQLAAFAEAAQSHAGETKSHGVEPEEHRLSAIIENANWVDQADPNVYPLSDAQRRFWLLDQLGQSNAFVHVPVSFVIAGCVDLRRWETAWTALAAKHPMLRTRVVEEEGRAVQRIESDVRVSIETDGKRTTIDVGQSPLFRVAIQSDANGDSRVDLLMHHMICDAKSMEVLIADLDSLLRRDPSGDGVETSRDCEASIAYSQYAIWDQSRDRQAAFVEGESYWRERLRDVPSELNLPERRDLAQNDGDRIESPNVWKAPVHRDVIEGVQRIAAQYSMTASMVCLNVFENVLARYGDNDDFVITIPTSNRPATALNRTVGCFVNPLMYRATVDPEQSVAEAMTRTRDRLLGDLDHASVPFHQVIESADVIRNAHRMPLSQVMFLFQPSLPPIDRLGDDVVRSWETDYSAVTAYDLSLVVQPGSDPNAQMDLVLVAGDSMDREVAEQFFGVFQTALKQITTEPLTDLRVRDLQVRDSQTRGLAVDRDVDESVSEATGFDSLVGRVQGHARETPEKVAVCDDQNSVTYAELDSLSNRLAASLMRRGAKPGDLIGIDLPRSTEMMVAILGVWKSGCAYLPFDGAQPDHRRQRILDDAQPFDCIDSILFQTMVNDHSVEALEPVPIGGNDLSYVMYTSGSTGQPKGVAVEHRGVSNLLSSFAQSPGFKSGDSMLAVTTITFDISVLEMMLPLWCGGTVRVTAHRLSDEPERVAKVIKEFSPTHIQSTPSAFRMLLSTKWVPNGDHVLICGGEPLMPDLATELLASNDRLWNVYGPTETTVWSTMKRIRSSEVITIGHPIANTTCYVLDRHGLDVPVGVAGELFLGGTGVARGYFNDAPQTSQRFIEHAGQRLYRTGDQVRMRFDGELEFLARNDRQVKIRGFRVELDEIESALQLVEGIDRAAVVMRGDSSGNGRLFAYCAVSKRASSQAIESMSLKQELSKVLPDYMIPQVIEFVSDLPTTPAGKTNYKALPDRIVDVPAQASEEPQTPIERVLAETWCEILERDHIGRNDHFFDIGGNSLMAAQLFARMRERFDVNLRLSEIFRLPTIAALAEAIVQNQTQAHFDDMEDLLSQMDSISEDDALKALQKDS